MDYDIAAAIVIIVVLTVYFIRERYKNRSSKLFIALAANIFIAATFDSITMYTNSFPEVVSVNVNYILNIIFFLSFNATPLLIYIYVVAWVKQDSISSFNRAIAMSAFVVQLTTIVSTPFTRWIFYFEDNIYYRGDMIFILVLVAGMLVILSLVTCYIYRERIDRLKRNAVYLFAVVAFFSLTIQLKYPYLILTNFMASLFVMVLYLTLQDPENFLDKKTECLNKKAFSKIIREQFMMSESGAVLFLEFEGLSYINRMLGIDASNERLVSIADFLRRAFGNRMVFHMESGKFSIILKSKEEARKAAERISFYYNQEETFKEIEISWIPKMSIVSYPQMASNLEDILDIAQYFYDEKLNANTSIVVADETTLNGKKRANLVIQAVNRAIKNQSFEVYFQPIMNAKTENVVSAEALVRLIDDELGFISPEEFIVVAEEHGCIVDVDRIVLDKVCKFLYEQKLENYGIDCVEVNLSVVELMQDDLADEILETMDRYGISHNQISFEITETAYMYSESNFAKNVKRIVEMGSSISMDDYGTGFSNSWNLTKFPYHLVKIDKSILWESVTSKTARVVLENSVQILQKIKREIVVEGVETKEQVELLQKLQVEKLQGYYYSRPLPMNDFMEFLKRNDRGGSVE